MSKLIKPAKKKKEYFDYNECRDYIIKKYKLDSSELWNWLIDNREVSNGSSFSIYFDDLDYMSKDREAKQFAQKLFEEFGPEDSEIEFEVSW